MSSIYSLTSVESIKNYRVFNGEVLKTTPEQNELLEKLIDTITKRFENYCDRKFASRDYTEYTNALITDVLYPKQYPLNSVTSIHQDFTLNYGDNTLISSDDYVVRDNKIIFKYAGLYMDDYTESVKIVYNAGYDIIPSDLEHSCIIEVLRIFDRIKSFGLLSESDGAGTSYNYITTTFLEDTETTLNNYKRKTAF